MKKCLKKMLVCVAAVALALGSRSDAGGSGGADSVTAV